MTYRAIGTIGPDLSSIDTVAKFRVGQEVEAFDDVLQIQGTFVYLPGVAATAVGTLVDYSLVGTPVTAISPATGGNGQIAVSLTANILAANFAWYQVRGLAAVKAPNAMVVGAEVWMLAATPGSVDDAVVAGEQVLNAKVGTTTGTPAAGLAYVQIDKPFHQGGIT